jgi:hypothetical protein
LKAVFSLAKLPYLAQPKLSSHWERIFPSFEMLLEKKLWTITGGRILEEELANFDFQNY